MAWEVLVAAGQPVAEGDTLLIVESMKMEIRVATPVARMLKACTSLRGGSRARRPGLGRHGVRSLHASN